MPMILSQNDYLQQEGSDTKSRPQELGIFDAQKEKAKEGLKHEQDFDNMVDKSDKVLIRIKSVFPFDFFPNEITVDVNKVNIIINYFLSQKVHSVFIKDICDVYVYSDILFSSLHIVDWGFNNNKSIDINYLKKSEAEEALNIIQGLVASSKQNIDVSKIDVPNFKNKVEKIGEIKSMG